MKPGIRRNSSVQSFLESQHARLNGYAYEVQTYDPFGGILCHVTKADVQNPEASSPRVRVHYRTDHYSYRLEYPNQCFTSYLPVTLPVLIQEWQKGLSAPVSSTQRFLTSNLIAGINTSHGHILI